MAKTSRKPQDQSQNGGDGGNGAKGDEDGEDKTICEQPEASPEMTAPPTDVTMKT